jgi:hypothetical protein
MPENQLTQGDNLAEAPKPVKEANSSDPEAASSPDNKENEELKDLPEKFEGMPPEEKMHFVEDIMNTLAIREEQRAEARYRRGFIGRVSWRLNRFLENDPKGRAVKIASKVILGGAAAATAIGLAGTAGLALSPLLFAMGTKVGSSGIIEMIQEFRSLGRSRRALAENKIAFKDYSTEKVQYINRMYGELQKNGGDKESFFESIRSQLEAIQKEEDSIVENENKDIQLAAKQKRWRGALSTGVSVAAGMMMGVPFGVQHFRGIPPVHEGGKLIAGAINNPHEVVYHVGRGWEFMYNNAAELVGRHVTTNNIVPGFMAHVLGHLPPQAANWGLGMMTGGLIAKTAEELLASNGPVGSPALGFEQGLDTKTASETTLLNKDPESTTDGSDNAESGQEKQQNNEKENSQKKGELVFDQVLKYLQNNNNNKEDIYESYKKKGSLKELFGPENKNELLDILNDLEAKMLKKDLDGSKKDEIEKIIAGFKSQIEQASSNKLEQKIIKFFLLMQNSDFSSKYSSTIGYKDLINISEGTFDDNKFKANENKYDQVVKYIKEKHDYHDYNEEKEWIVFNKKEPKNIKNRIYISAKLDQDPAAVVKAWFEAVDSSKLSKDIYYEIGSKLLKRPETIVIYLDDTQSKQIDDNGSAINKLLDTFYKDCDKSMLLDEFPSAPPTSRKGVFLVPEPIRINKIQDFLGGGQTSYNKFIANAFDQSMYLVKEILSEEENSNKSQNQITNEEITNKAKSIFVEFIRLSGIDPETMRNYPDEN